LGGKKVLEDLRVVCGRVVNCYWQHDVVVF
jgi:hypothetical protein